MTPPLMFRSLAAALFAVCVGLATLPGCNGPAPKTEKKDEKKEEPKPGDPNPAPIPTPNPGPDAPPPKSTLGKAEPAAEQAATAFLRDLVHGTAKADALSVSFLKAVGKPLVFEGDKTKGFSTDSATSWLKKVGDGVGFGLALTQEQAGDVVYIRGGLQKPGGYCLRLVKEGGVWKVDWLSVSSVENGTLQTTTTAEGAAQAFAVAAFVESVADLNGMPKEERAAVIGAALTPALRTAWAAPFDQDKTAGYDFNPGKLGTEAVKIGGGTTAFTAARVGDLPEFKVELTKLTGKKTYVVKLVKGTGPSEWLVSEVTEVQPKG